MKILGSKKFQAAIVGILVVLGVQFLGLDEDKATEVCQLVVGLLGTFIVGQGVADHGKGKVEAENGG